MKWRRKNSSAHGCSLVLQSAKAHSPLPQAVAGFIWHFVKPQRWAFAFILFAAMLWSVNHALFPYFIKLIVNQLEVLPDKTTDALYQVRWPLIALLGFWFFTEGALRVQGFVCGFAFPRFRADIRARAFAIVQQHSLHYFASTPSGVIANKLNALPNQCVNILSIVFFNFFNMGFTFIASMLLLLGSVPVFAVIAVVWVTVHLLISIVFVRSGLSFAKVHADSVADLAGQIGDSFGNMLSVKSFARQSHEQQVLANVQQTEINHGRRQKWKVEQMKLLQSLAGAVYMAAVLITAIEGWTQGWMTLGDFTLVLMLAYNLFSATWNAAMQIANFVEEVGRVKSALGLFESEHQVLDMPGAKALQVKQGNIEFNQVQFGYYQPKGLFEGLSVNIKAGEKVGLVGCSGAGKSTFLHLLLRFYDVDDGQITIDGQAVSQVTKQSLRENIAYIPQSPNLFHRSIMENIRYGRLDASDEEVIAAAKAAHCHEFIITLEQQYDTLVGEQGVKLSGGQRQRIAIARAFLKKAPILLLDEATSALDSATEQKIDESLQLLSEGRTTLVIAHRLATVKSMDRLLVFKRGEIVEDGTIDQLLAANGHFAHLWRLQHHDFMPERLQADTTDFIV